MKNYNCVQRYCFFLTCANDKTFFLQKKFAYMEKKQYFCTRFYKKSRFGRTRETFYNDNQSLVQGIKNENV